MRINNNLPTQYCRESIIRICSLLFAPKSKHLILMMTKNVTQRAKRKKRRTTARAKNERGGSALKRNSRASISLHVLKFKRLPRKTTLPSSHIKSPKHEPIKKRHNTISHSFKHVAVFHWTHLQYCKIL